MQSRLPGGMFTPRGWGLIAAGAAALLTAQLMGRRDLLAVAVLLLALPAAAALSLRLLKPGISVERTFSPAAVETGTEAAVSLTVLSRHPLQGTAVMREGLPLRFGASPVFHFPGRNQGADGRSIYEYRLRSNRRGRYPIGPVTAEFLDPFNLARAVHTLGSTDHLVVTPAPLPLPATALTGPRGTEGSVSSPRRGNPSEDDVSTREYRYGDPMRRVHWGATARHAELMVRQEEPVTAPRATILFDQRQGGYPTEFSGSFWADSADETGGRSSEAFEWAVSAVMSVTVHLMDNGYTVRLLDERSAPGLSRSVSAPFPQEMVFDGPSGLLDLAEGLAAVAPDSGGRDPEQHTLPAGQNPPRRSGSGTGSGNSPAGGPFGLRLIDALAGQREQGPLVAVLGRLSAEDARRLAPAAEYSAAPLALLVSDAPQTQLAAIDILRASGWSVTAPALRTPIADAWAGLEIPGGSAAQGRTAAAVPKKGFV